MEAIGESWKVFLFYVVTAQCNKILLVSSGGSRISRRRGVDPLRGGVDLRRRRFLLKMYVKTKELGPVGGVCAGHAPP